MSLSRRILLIWAVTIVTFLASFILPHREVTIAGFLTYSLQSLLFFISLYLIKHETVKKTKVIFVNFAAFFSTSFLFHLYNFVGTVFFNNELLARHFYFQYVSHGLYFFLLAFSICYITIDVLFRDFKTFQKYLLTFAIVGGFFAYYYQPYFSNARYLYTTSEISEFRELDKASSAFEKQYGAVPTGGELTGYLPHSEAAILNHLSETERIQRVEDLYPYLSGSNYMTLLLKPIYLNAIYMCLLGVGLILLFFGYQYKKDPPQGAYIEKMMFFFLMFCTLEVFHAWSFIKTIEWQSSLQIFEIGQFLSAVVLAIIAIFFALRLRFITSPSGEFYEHEIVESPSSVTRWRDALDNLVIAHFFRRNELVGRFFVDPKLRTK